MDTFTKELVNEFIKFVKKRKFFFVLLMIVVVVMLAKKYLFPVYQVIIKSVESTIQIVVLYYYAAIFMFIILVISCLLLKKSDNEFKKEVEEHHPDYENYVSSSKVPIETKVYEKYEKIDGEYKKTRKLSIHNGLEEKIEYIKGSVQFYYYRERVFVIDFEVSDIGVYRGHRIFYGIVDRPNRWWNEFNIKIDIIKAGSYEKENLRLSGVHFFPTHFLILNRYNYIRIGKFRLPYEISWLKNSWFRRIRAYIRWHFRRRNRYGRLTYKQYYGDLFKNWCRIVISIPIIIGSIGGVGFFIGSFFIMMYKIFKLWIITCIDSIKILF